MLKGSRSSHTRSALAVHECILGAFSLWAADSPFSQVILSQSVLVTLITGSVVLTSYTLYQLMTFIVNESGASSSPLLSALAAIPNLMVSARGTIILIKSTWKREVLVKFISELDELIHLAQ